MDQEAHTSDWEKTVGKKMGADDEARGPTGREEHRNRHCRSNERRHTNDDLCHDEFSLNEMGTLLDDQ
jgi:hypothetical protein